MTNRFFLPQADQPFEGTVDTRIGTLDFDNQYPSKASSCCGNRSTNAYRTRYPEKKRSVTPAL